MSQPLGTPPPPPAGSASSNRSLMTVLSYLWILFLVPLLVEKDDAEVQWHAKHGMVLTIAEIIVSIGLFVVNTILSMMSGGLGCILGILSPLVWVGFLIVRILRIVKGVNGQRFIVPGVSQYADKVNF
jgi:uncharacterized membrane protein